MRTPNLNALWAKVLIEGLCGGTNGARHAAISPGSRSSPLVIAAALQPGLETTVHLDERSAAFFALGVAKGSGSPGILICTSGTAAANYFPAVIEASQSRVPLILLTADRPAEEREAGSAQTIDQVHLYGRYVRAFQDLPVPEPCREMLRTVGALAAHAAARACGPLPGPVHLNLPFREPLAPEQVDPDGVAALEKDYRDSFHGRPAQMTILAEPPAREARPVGPLAERIATARRALLVAGPEAARSIPAESVAHFVHACGMPLLADIASGYRFLEFLREETCAHADIFLRAESLASDPPDLVIQVGGLPTSKVLRDYLRRHRPPLVRIDPDLERRDPDALAEIVVEDRGGTILGRLADETGSGACERSRSWRERFRRAERIVRDRIAQEALPLEVAAVRRAIAELPRGAAVFLSNSLPIRYGETYLSAGPGGLEVFVSRGANGIDGVASTGLGIGYGRKAPVLIVTGDLAYLHDLGGLRASRYLTEPAVVLLLNNDGGGIFSHLPIARFPEFFEKFFATPHGCDLEPVARIFALDHRLARDADDVEHLVRDGMRSAVTRIVEVRADRSEMARRHADLMNRLAGAVDAES